MQLDEEIAWWTQWISRNDEIGFLALGVAHGLKLAKADYGARDEEVDLLVARSQDRRQG